VPGLILGFTRPGRSSRNHGAWIGDIDLTTSDPDDEPVPLFPQNSLNASDSVTLLIEEVPDALEQVDIVRSVIAPAAAALHRLDLRKPGFPEAENMLWQVQVVCHLTDGTKRVRALIQYDPPVPRFVLTRRCRPFPADTLCLNRNRSKPIRFILESKKKMCKGLAQALQTL